MSEGSEGEEVKEIESGGEEAMGPPRIVNKDQIVSGLSKI